jgi:hypothetical protein
MARTIELTDEEEAVLGDMCDFWAEGFADAEQMTIGDRSISSPEELLEVTNGLRIDKAAVDSLRQKVVAHG